MSKIAERLLMLINNNNVSYGDLSKQTGIPKSAIHRYATGETEKIPITRIELLAKALHSSAAYLMGWTEDESKVSPKSSDYDNDTYSEILALLEAMPEQKRENAIEYLKFLSNQNDK